jgi:L-ascorbate metabolism protein UlaG (beta-lactamase superfamily)
MIEAIFHGHSFVELLTAKGSILIDPFITGNTYCDCTVDQIGSKNILAICLTHGHSDHVGDTISIAQKTSCPVIAMVELGKWLEKQGVKNVELCNIG